MRTVFRDRKKFSLSLPFPGVLFSVEETDGETTGLKAHPDDTLIPRIQFEDTGTVKLLYGENDENLKLIEKYLNVRIQARGNTLTVGGDPIDRSLTERLLQELYEIIRRGHPIYPSDVLSAIRILSGNQAVRLQDILLDTIYISSKRRRDHPQEPGPEAIYRRHPDP